MKNTKDPRLKLALKLQQRLEQRTSRPERDRQVAMLTLLDQLQQATRQILLGQRARDHQWPHAAAVCDRNLGRSLRQIYETLGHSLSTVTSGADRGVPLSDLYLELCQLPQEFDAVAIDVRHQRVTIETDSIELEDIDLGAFRIELHLDRLGDRPNASAFEIVALQPNPPDSSEDVTHPHVRDGQLCAGDATVPIARALEQGRICDAFLAVHSVLQTYNSGSPYVPLSDWHGRPCDDCGHLINPDDTHYCEGCHKDFCEDCIGWCEICETSYCLNCLEEDQTSGRSCCRGCRHRCGQCRRIVDHDSFVEESGLCPECHEEHQQENDHESSESEPESESNTGTDPGRPAEPYPPAVA